MDGYSLFRQLGAGAKFDFKRFHKDAERLKLVKPEESQEHCDSTDGKEEKWKDRDFIDEENAQSHAEQEGKKEKAGVKKKSLSAKKKADLHQEKVNHIRKKKKIHVYGSDIPDPVVSFDQLHTEYMVHQKILENTKNVGYETPTPIQMQAIPVMIQHREILACAPTGSGKTAAFIIPILHHLKEPRNCGIRAVVISPTRELSKQTFREFYRLSEGQGFRIHYIHKATLKKYKPNSLKKIDILVTTPNRLTFLLKREPQVLSLSRVEWLVVDESDKLFEAGRRGFRDQLAVVYKACDSPDICRAMFSATFAYDVEEWCKLNLDNVVQVYIGGKNLAAETVSQELLFVGTEAGKLLAVRDIVRKGIEPPVLIFVQSKERAKELFHELIYDGINVDVIHADRTQQQRDNTIKSFREGKIWILICTELLGRGIDFKGVNLVINFDFPNSAISYIHRIGRTGRAGQTGKAVTFFVEDDSANLRSIANVMKEAGCLVPEYMLKMKKATSKQRKKLAGTTLKRKNISTTLLPDKRKKLRKVIEKKKKTDQTPAAATLPCESSTTPSPLASHLDLSKNEM